MGQLAKRIIWCAICLLSVVVLGSGCARIDEVPDQPSEELTLDLMDRFGDATVWVESRRVDLSPAAEHGDLLEGWSTSSVRAPDGSRVVECAGIGGALRFSVAIPRDLPVAALIGTGEDGGADEFQIEIAVNGKTATTLALTSGFEERRFVIPESSLVSGDNILVFRPKRPKSVHESKSRIRLASLTFFDGAPIPGPAIGDMGLFLPFGSSVSYLLQAPSRAALELEQSGEAEGFLWLSIRQFGEPHDFLRVVVPGGETSTVDLPVAPMTWVRVTISSLPTSTSPQDGDGLYVDRLDLRFRASGDQVAAVRSSPQWRDPASPRQNVVIYLVDTLRADHLGCYGYEKLLSPFIDRFAADGVIFDQTMAQTSWTRTAVASIFTGMVPTSHGVIGRKDGLSEEAETLAEVLAGAGYDTASFVATGHVSPRWGMAQGFETFSLETRNDMGLRYALSNGLNPPVISWLERDRDRPFFLYVHTLDPHSPYAPTREAAAKFAADVTRPELSPNQEATLTKMATRLAEATGKPAPVDMGSQVWVQALKQGVIESTPEMLEDLIALYDAEIYHNDIYFGELIDYLRESGQYDNTLIVFVADHGEEFLDHDFWTHGHTLYREQLNIPLIMKFPDSTAPRGRRVQGLARQIDIAPTITDYLGIRAPGGTQGNSLLPMVHGVGFLGEARHGYAHLKLDQSFGESFFDGRWKLICTDEEWAECQLYDLDRDRLETNDLAGAYPERVADLKDQMKSYLGRIERLEAFEADPDEQIRQQLEALGYAF